VDAHQALLQQIQREGMELKGIGADEELGLSPLTLAEVYVGPARAGKLAQAQQAIRDLEVTVVPLDDAPERLASLRSSTGLRLPDCCVLYAAQAATAELATFDDRLGSAARYLGLAVRG
jgi:predicted nucleic acid-binding protein